MNACRLALSAAVVAATMSAAAEGARAQTYLASMLIGDLRVTVSTVPLTRATGDKAVSLPTGSSAGLVTDKTLSGGTGSGWNQMSFTASKSGVYWGSSSLAQAPVAIGGTPITDSYIAARTSHVALTFPTVSSPDHIDFLWGSVSASDAVMYNDGTGGKIITGAQILSIASTGGVTGTNGSYYVSLDLVPSRAATHSLGVFYFGWGASSANPVQEFSLLPRWVTASSAPVNPGQSTTDERVAVRSAQILFDAGRGS